MMKFFSAHPGYWRRLSRVLRYTSGWRGREKQQLGQSSVRNFDRGYTGHKTGTRPPNRGFRCLASC